MSEISRSYLSEEDTRIARGLKRIRIEKKLTMERAGALLGVHISTISRTESFEYRWVLSPARTARALGVTVRDLLAPCPRCAYTPYEGYTCNRCGTSGDDPRVLGRKR